MIIRADGARIFLLCRCRCQYKSGTCPSGTDKPPRKATFNATLRCKTNCEWKGKWIAQDYGWTAIGPSGDSIFFPFGGYSNNRFNDKVLARNYCGLYLTSEIRYGNSTFIRLEKNDPQMEPRGDIEGFISVRLVMSKK
jgi:hypothetical protein